MGRLVVGAALCLAVMIAGCGESTRGARGSTEGGSGEGGSSGTTAARGGSGASGGAGAGSGPAGSGGVVGGAAGGDSDGGTGEFFIEAHVDGELVRVEVDVRAYWFQGIAQGYVNLEAVTDELGWYLTVPNHDGATECGAGTIALIHGSGSEATYHLSEPFVESEHSCSILVNRAAPNVGDVIEGTFRGELTPVPGDQNATLSVTDGAFRAPRVVDGQPP